MNFTKTFCKPNSVVTIVPSGLQIVLQYSEHGLLQQVRIGFKPNLDPMYNEIGLKFDQDSLLNKIKGLVPNQITANGGTTWVFGVCYSDKIPMVEGLVPQALYPEYIQNILNGDRFAFYAGYATSKAVTLNGSLIIRNFLTANKFNLLPHTVVTTTMQEATIAPIIQSDKFPFDKHFVAGYFIFEDLSCRYASGSLEQIKVTHNPKLTIGADGFWKANVSSQNEDIYSFSYSAIIHNNIQKGAVLLLDRPTVNSNPNIVCTRIKDGEKLTPAMSSQQVNCPVCGKINYTGTTNTPVQCDDPHCLSHKYLDAQKMLKVLGLPELTYGRYTEEVKNHNITCMTDILLLPEYKDIEIRSTMAVAINAIVPTAEVPNADIFERFANKCNNNVDTVNYYLNNPLRIETDLDIVDPMIRRFASWLEDPYNALMVRTILDIVKIEKRTKKFDGDPIFRGNKFIITGRFRRGDYQEIASILESYSAEVVPSFELGTKLPNAVIQGSLNEGISGQVIQKARLHEIPIIDEDVFFAQYEIDEDLARNLL